MAAKPILPSISTQLSERAQVRLLPILIMAALGTAAVCLWEALAAPGVLAESALMAPLLAWAIYQAQIARLRARVVGQINQRLNTQMAECWRVEQALRSSEARFQAFMDNSPAVAFIKDEAGRYVYLNEPFARRFGVSQGDWLGKTVHEVLPADIAEMLRAETEETLSGGKPRQMLETVPTPDDPDCQWLSLRFPFRDSSGQQFLGCVAIDVTRQQRAEDRRREVASQLATLVEASPLAIFSFNREGRVQSWSLAAERMFGWGEDEVIGRGLPFVSEAQRVESQQLIARLLRGETFTDVEATRRKRDGSLIEISISAAPLHDNAGRVTGAMALVADITARKRNDEMRVRLEEILKATSDFVGIASPQGQILFHNPAFLTLTGNNSESILTQKMGTFHPVWAMEKMTQEALPAAKRDGIWSGETAFLAADGTEVPVSQVLLAHFGPDKELTGFSTIARDLTQHKRIEAELRQAHGEMEGRVQERTADLAVVNEWLHDEIAVRRQAEEDLRRAHDDLELRVHERTEELHKEREFLHALLNHLQEGIVACDAHGTLTVFNQATRDFHGLPEKPLPPEEWAGHFDLFQADGKTPLRTEDIPLFRAWRGAAVRQQEMVIAPKHGKTRTMLASGQAIHAPDGKILGAVVAMHDITERKAMERMKNEFISVVSHELRTPLTSIRGALGLIAGGVAGEIPPQAQTLVGIANSNTERLVRLVNDILDIEKMEAGQMEFLMRPVSLLPLLLQTLDNLRTYAGQYGVQLEMTGCPADTFVCADPDRLTQILTNLISNAAKFSPSGMTVTLSAEHTAGHVHIRVCDHGPGIPLEFQERIFEKFAQADAGNARMRGGTGLGLNICKALAERLGGQICFETRQGLGTTFTLNLPVYEGSLLNEDK